MVTAVGERSAVLMIKDKGEATLDWDGLKWARPYIADNRQGRALARPKRFSRPASRFGCALRVKDGCWPRCPRSTVPWWRWSRAAAP
ncbi:hypothetical protein MBH78_01370 [Oceanimonas sp. NS1]|nr:hypothetical protein [Oceanimonas sp. NS1]